MTRPHCPMCLHERSLRILRGTPDAEGWAQIRRLEAVLSSDDDPYDWFCPECRHSWHDAGVPGGANGGGRA